MDSNIAENIVLYDWLSFTSKTHTPEELINALGLGHCPWTEIKGAQGYRCRKYFSYISVHYDGREGMGVWVEMSGQGCRTFESLSQVGWEGIFQFIHDNNLNITRLDVAYDDHTGILPLERIVSDTTCGMYISRANIWECTFGTKGTTINIGSPKSEVFIRIYDKAAERNKRDEHWIRCEMQLRRDRAAQFTTIPLPIGEAFAGVLLNYLRYIIPDTDSNRWRWPMTDYWYNLVEDAEKISIYRSPGMEYNEERCRNYVINQAGNAIDAVIQMYGIYEFQKMIQDREVAPNPKYELLIKQHRFDVLANRVDHYFTNK